MAGPSRARDAAVARIEQSLSAIVREVNLPRLRERMVERAGVRVDRSAYPILRRLGEEGPVRLSDLASRMAVEISTVSRQVKQLDRAGMVARTGDPTDGRASVLTLTADGMATLAALRAAWHTTVAELVTGWPAGDVEELSRLLERLAGELVTFMERP